MLITLGIIGIVAAMTLPTLIANYQKKVLVTQLKNEISFIQNSIRRILADEEVDSLKNSSFLDQYQLHLDEEKFVKYLSLKKTNFVYDEVFTMYSNRSGACLSVSNNFSNLFLTMTLDVNCQKGPNKPGRDQFMIFLDDKGALIDSGDAIGAPIDFLNGFCNESLNEALGYGVLCAYKIMHDGWEMKY